jgi:Rrf2 family protein
MHYSVGVEYALHCLIYLGTPSIKPVLTVKELARFQGISETYLSKIFTKLSKSGIVKATPGVAGGYQLGKNPLDITFWDVVQAVEGEKKIFRCKNIIGTCALHDKKSEKEECPGKVDCLINDVMLDAEKQMELYLKEKNIDWLVKKLGKKLTKEYQELTTEWFNS